MGEWCLEEYRRFAAVTELKGGSKQERRLQKEGRGGGAAEKGWRAIETELLPMVKF